MQVETSIETDLWREFDRIARDRNENPADVLAGLIRSYIDDDTDEAQDARDLHDALLAREEAKREGTVSWVTLKDEMGL